MPEDTLEEKVRRIIVKVTNPIHGVKLTVKPSTYDKDHPETWKHAEPCILYYEEGGRSTELYKMHGMGGLVESATFSPDAQSVLFVIPLSADPRRTDFIYSQSMLQMCTKSLGQVLYSSFVVNIDGTCLKPLSCSLPEEKYYSKNGIQILKNDKCSSELELNSFYNPFWIDSDMVMFDGFKIYHFEDQSGEMSVQKDPVYRITAKLNASNSIISTEMKKRE
jgi:hypothetical protein